MEKASAALMRDDDKRAKKTPQGFLATIYSLRQITREKSNDGKVKAGRVDEMAKGVEKQTASMLHVVCLRGARKRSTARVSLRLYALHGRMTTAPIAEGRYSHRGKVRDISIGRRC